MTNHSSTIKTAKNYEITYLHVTKKIYNKVQPKVIFAILVSFLIFRALCAKRKEKEIKAFKTSKI